MQERESELREIVNSGERMEKRRKCYKNNKKG